MFDLKRFRLKETNLNQEQFATMIKVSRGTIAKIESGHQKPSDNIISKIEEAFKVSLDEFKSYNQHSEVKKEEDEDVTSWKERYYELLEKYNSCLVEKDKLKEEIQHPIKLLDKRVHK